MEKMSKLHYTKVMLSALLMVAASMGLCFYSAGVFYDPVAAGLNMSLGQASSMTTGLLVFMALTAVFVPGLLRRFKLQTLLLIGTALAAGSGVLLGFSFYPITLYIFSAVMGIGAALIGMVPATTLVNNWFEQKKSWTTSIVLAGSALSAALFSPLLATCINSLGWRMGFVLEAILILVLMVPALIWQVQLNPAAVGQVPYGQEEAQPKPAAKTPKAILGSFALMAIFSAALVGLAMHFSSLSSSLGASILYGATALSWCMIGNLVFKLLGGWLSDRLKPVLSSGIMDLVALAASIGILISIMTRSASAMAVLAFLYGSVFALNELSLPLLISTRVSRRHYSTVYGLMNFLSTLTTAIAISVIGFLYDSSATYLWILVITIAEEVVIALLIWYLIHDAKADDLVTTSTTRSFIARLRAASKRRAQEKSIKAQARKEEAERKKAADTKEKEKAADDTADSSRQMGDTIFNRQMELIDSEPGAQPDFEQAAPTQMAESVQADGPTPAPSADPSADPSAAKTEPEQGTEADLHSASAAPEDSLSSEQQPALQAADFSSPAVQAPNNPGPQAASDLTSQADVDIESASNLQPSQTDSETDKQE